MNKEFTYPTGLVRLRVNHQDERGWIMNLREGLSGGVAIIESREGTVRSNHWHKTDSHLLYILKGSCLYFERPVGSTDIPVPIIYGMGDMFYTPPQVEHAIVFVAQTTMISISDRPRDHESHEEDVVRVNFISDEDAREVIRVYRTPNL